MADNKAFDYVMLDYNIMRQDRELLINKIIDAGAAVIASSTLGESLYSKKIYRIKERNDFWYLARVLVRFKELLKKSKDFNFLTKQNDYTANQIHLDMYSIIINFISGIQYDKHRSSFRESESNKY